jgi:hypothetical protein
MPVPRPDLAGQRMQEPGQTEVYLIDDNGLKRWIPNPATYDNLFPDWDGIVADPDLPNIETGLQISDGALLAKDPNSAPIWFIDPAYQKKRWVTSPAAMNKFHFNWNNVIHVPNNVLEAIPDGGQIT